MKKKTFRFMGQDCRLERRRYWDGSTAVNVVYGRDQQMARLTTCLQYAVDLAPNEILVKTWSENREVSQAVLEAGLARDTGVRYPASCWVEAQVWVLTD